MYAGHDAQKCPCYIGVFVSFSSNGGDESEKTVWFQDGHSSDPPGNSLALFFFAMGLKLVASFQNLEGT